MNRVVKCMVAATTALAAAGAGGTWANAQSEGGKFDHDIKSTVRVLARQPDGSSTYGTGWVISAADKVNRAGAAVIVTARHVVDGAVSVTVVEPGSKIDDQRVATVSSSTPERDIAFLEVKGLTEQPLTLSRTPPNVGDVVRALGYAGASDANETDLRASVASLKGGELSKAFAGRVSDLAQAPINQLEFDAPVLGGFSGGPVLNDCGNVVGMTLKDGGHIRLAEGAQIDTAQGVDVAIAADEIIKAANDAGIHFGASTGACGGPDTGQVPGPAKVAQCPHSGMSQDAQGNPCAPPPPPPHLSAWEQVQKFLSTPRGQIILVAAIALLVIVVVLVVVATRRRRDYGSNVHASPSDGSGSSLADTSGSRLGSRGATTTSGQTLRLTGRGPAGEPIDLRYTSDELAGSGVMLGVEGDDNGRIPDARPNRFVGRRHARLLFDGRNFVVEDNKAVNKTKVGGQDLASGARRALISGDTLTLADVALHVSID